MPFIKLDVAVLDSTLWIDKDGRDVFITALLMAAPQELKEPAAQLSVRTMEPTGWTVPPGWYGLIEAAGIGIMRRAGIASQDAGITALERLGSPEAESRSTDFEGRRLVRIDGGYIVLNYMKYRDRDYGAKDRMRRLRERQRGLEPAPDPAPVPDEPVTVVTPEQRNSVTLKGPVTPNVTQADADADADAKKSKASARGTRLPDGWVCSDSTWLWSKASRPKWNQQDWIATLDAFRDHWAAKPGKDGRKTDWDATWRNWIRREPEIRGGRGGEPRAGAAPKWRPGGEPDGVLKAAAEKAGVAPWEHGETHGQFRCRIVEAGGERYLAVPKD